MSHSKVLSSAVAAALVTQFSMPATAQQAAPPVQAETELEEIVVVGTQIRGVDPVGSDPIVLSTEEMQVTGLANTADILRRLPQNQTAIGGNAGQQGGTANQGYNGAQVETINLRGLGAGATLILLDGRRVVGQGAAATATDANQIPISALQRLEILADGASAVYGSDAVAGVVNFVPRRDFEGIEATLRSDDQSGGTQIGGTLIGGTVWNNLGGLGRGNVLVTYEHLDRDAFRASDVARLRHDLRPLGGPDTRLGDDDAEVGFSPNIISQGAAPNTTIPRALNYTYWGVPSGDGTGLSSANLRLNDPNLEDASRHTDWTGEQVRDQLAVFFNQELTDSFEAFANLTYTDRETTSEQVSGTVRIPLAGTPFFIADLPVNQQVQYSTLKDDQTRKFDATAETLGAVLGLRMKLPGEWNGEVFYNYGNNEQCDSCTTGSINLAAMTAQVQAGNINPLSSVPLTAEQIDQVYKSSKFESRTTLDQFAAKFDGSLFELPAGPVRAAVGAEYRTETNANRNNSQTGPTNQRVQISTYGGTEYDRDVTSAFLELNIPLLESLTLSAAVRYDDYSDVGDTTNPKFGLTWDVTDQFSLQGTWGTSFRAPSVTDSNPNAVTSGSALVVPNYDTRITNGVLPPGILGPFGLANSAVMLGSNPDLSPEEADTWSLTANWKQGGFNVGLTYWDIKYDDQIIFPGSIGAYLGANASSPPGYLGWGAYIIPVNNPDTCVDSDLSTADPVLQSFLETVNYDFIAGGGDYSTLSTLGSDFCKVNVIVDSRIQNVGSVQMNGIDFNTSYTHDFGGVNLLAQLALTHYLKNEISTGPGIPAEDKMGALFDPSSVFEWSGTAGLTALWKGFDTTLTARYLDQMVATGQLLDNGLPGAPDKDLSAYVQLDLSLGYSAEFDERRFGLKGWRALLAISNFTDEEPDFFTPSGDPPGSWHFKYGLPFGRTYSAQLTGRF
jgi:iron complex outermembrane receptor protein